MLEALTRPFRWNTQPASHQVAVSAGQPSETSGANGGFAILQALRSFVFREEQIPVGSGFVLTRRTALLDTELVGGKAHNLIKLFRMGVPVPESFVITCAEYSRGIKDQTISVDVRNALTGFLNKEQRYAVRSSANVEDGADSAYAGRFGTELNVPGDVESICQAIVKCWNSMNAPDLVDILSPNARMAVVVMRQIDSQRSGVLFQANPITGSRATYVITAAYGQGEGIVGGKLAVDTYNLKESTLEVRYKQVVKKERKLALDPDHGTKEVTVPAELQELQCMSDSEIIQVAKVGKQIRDHCLSPQDIEFAIDERNKLYILQTRPITTLSETLIWRAPRPGFFQLNGHLPVPMSEFYGPMWCVGMSRGGYFNTSIAGFGAIAMETCLINGFGYFCIRNPGPKAAPTSLPPPFVMRQILRLTARDGIAKARTFWNDKLYQRFMVEEYPKKKEEWKKDMDKWVKLLEAAPSMSDTELAKVIGEAQDWGGWMYGEHAEVTIYNIMPVAYFVLTAIAMTGCEAVDGFAAIDGFSPVTMGYIGEFPTEFKVIAADADLVQLITAKDVLSDNEAAKRLYAELDRREAKTESVKALQHILRVVRYRLTEGYDSANGTLLENPILIFQAFNDGIQKFKDGALEKARQRGLAAGTALLARVKNPADEAELQSIMDDARLLAGLRDERAIWTDLTACGVIHHLLLECGRRLADRSKLSTSMAAAELILEASRSELQEYLADKGRIAPPESFWTTLLKRKKYRQEANVLDAPQYIGGPKLTPTREHFPDPFMARSVECIIWIMDQIFAAPDYEAEGNNATRALQNDKSTIIGNPGAKGSVRGRARIITSVEEATSLEDGEICVTRYPSSLINLILGKAGGIVTDLGGMLCHAAICAREYQIPCVVGCHTATSRIKSGDIIEVDGMTGIVKILSEK